MQIRVITAEWGSEGALPEQYVNILRMLNIVLTLIEHSYFNWDTSRNITNLGSFLAAINSGNT